VAVLALLSALLGGLAGLIVALFRLAIVQADHWRGVAIDRAHTWGVPGFLAVVGTAVAMTAVAAWLVRRFAPRAAGSGIPDVEAMVRGELPPKSLRLLPVKFLGGLLSMAPGLALGREGPSVEMGAVLGGVLGRAFRRHWPDCRALIAAGGGAGLATAFNAPIAGAVFVLDEIFRRFEVRSAIATIGASAGAIAVARWLLGQEPDFKVPPIPYQSLHNIPLYLVVGVLAGFLGIAYNRATLGALSVADRLGRWPVELRAGLIGAGVGILAWFMPQVVGGGESLTEQVLNGVWVPAVLPLIFGLRFILGAVSYAAKTPGGLFAPLLVLGASFGQLLGAFFHYCAPQLAPHPHTFAIVGMAAFFTAAVRAPLSGIVLVTEMTAGFPLLLPMLVASFAALVVPTLLRDPPIYDTLRERAASQAPSD
jgi:CIC family chloride channel protein